MDFRNLTYFFSIKLFDILYISHHVQFEFNTQSHLESWQLIIIMRSWILFWPLVLSLFAKDAESKVPRSIFDQYEMEEGYEKLIEDT